MIRIGITGYGDFLGKHLRWYLFPYDDQYELVEIDENIDDACTVDAIVHLFSASKTNTPEEHIYKTNVEYTKKLLSSLDQTGKTPYIIYASSTHIYNDNPYGKSKKAVGELLRAWANKNGKPVTNLIIPNEFGEGCKPFTTSVVATFAHQLVNNAEVQINPDATVELIHGQSIAHTIVELINDPKDENLRLEGVVMSVKDVYETLKHYKEAYYSGIIPELVDSFHTALFNTLRSHIITSGFYPRSLTLHEDTRGSLFEMVKERTGGQTFISTTKPGITRGDHYHTRKVERFCVLQGEARVDMRDILTDEVLSFEGNGDNPVYLDMPTFFTHNITNIGESDLVTSFWSNEIFDPEDTDTYYVKVNNITSTINNVTTMTHKKIKVMTVIGTRPEIIKLSEVIRELDVTTNHVLVHTGQNYDYELNEIFFKQLGLRKPDHFLEVVGNSSAATVGRVIEKIDEILEEEQPDAFLLLGDTNSGMGAYAAKRRKIPIFHMEAGNRCFDMRVPEEVNRRVLDHLSDINMVYSDITRHNLLNEGLPMDRILKTGSPTYEVLMRHMESIKASTIVADMGLTKHDYFVLSAHREENIDIKENFDNLVKTLVAVSEKYQKKIIFSVHPRTKKRIEERGVTLPENIIQMKPLGMFDYVSLQMNSFCVLTDSGTLSEEGSMLNFPGVSLRETHERLEGMEDGAFVMAGLNPERVIQAIELVTTQSRDGDRDFDLPGDYAHTNVSKRVGRFIVSYTDYIKRVVWSE